MIIPLYKGKGERTDCSNYRGINLSVLGKIYAGIPVNKVKRLRVIDDEQGGFKTGKGCVDQIFTLKQITEKAREKKCSVCGFYGPGEGI